MRIEVDSEVLAGMTEDGYRRTPPALADGRRRRHCPRVPDDAGTEMSLRLGWSGNPDRGGLVGDGSGAPAGRINPAAPGCVCRLKTNEETQPGNTLSDCDVLAVR